MNLNETLIGMQHNKKTYVSYKNSFVWGYNEIPFSFRTSKDDKYFVQYGKLTREPLPWREECIATAELIYEEANGEIPFVMFSGGMDSQVTAEAFRLAGVPFKVVTVRLNKKHDSWNWHDMKFAVEWCDAYNVEQIILDIDVVKFWENEAWEYGAPVQSWSPQFCVNLWGIDQVEGFPVVGIGEAVLERDNKIPTKCWDVDTELYRCTDRHLIYKNRNGAPVFFKYTPELKMSQLLDLESIKFANNIEYKDTAQCYHKNEMYIVHFPNLKPRPKIISKWRKGREYTDYNGFEFMPKYALEAEEVIRTELQKHFGYYEEIYVDYDEQMENLTTGYEYLYEDFKNKRIN
jgi:hypothetical protein